MQFIEGIPTYLNERRNHSTDQYDSSRIMAALLQHDDYSFSHKQLPSFLQDRTERSMSATLDLISCLAGRRLFPYDLSPEEKQFYWNLIPVPYYFYPETVQEFPSLSSTINRTKFLAIIRCSEDISQLNQHPGLRLPEEYFLMTWQWVDILCYMDVLAWQGKEFDDFRQCLESIELSPWVQHSLDSPEFKTTLAALALKGLCNFVLEEMNSLSGETEPIIRDAIDRCIQLTSFLAHGSSQQQQAYAAAVWLITSLLDQHCKTQAVKDPSDLGPQHLLTPILQPLVNITDVNAVQSVRRTLSSTVWWEDSRISFLVFDYFQGNRILRDPAIASIYWVKGLIPQTYYPDAIHRIASHLEHCPSSLAGLPPTLQNEVASYLKLFNNPNVMVILRSLAVALFRIAGTLDDAKAVTQAMKHLEMYIPRFDELYQNLDQTNKVQHLLDAKESLEKLKQTAQESGFVYQALALRLH
ncbi:hypothetical protein C8J56DRAFT_968310, partial [Mycena floridula]